MDDTQQSRASDAGATRKRRSSILKSQRAPRTPFSELEFNVATPTDTAKSRRVSFSKRTGVAEFVTNEATTTWKNFYEEHNKSLESSGNDSGAARQPIGHLGKRIFDQQFEEVEAVDFITSLDNLAARNINTTLNVNFTEQIASLECSDDKKLTAPQNNFELSAFTDHHSKLFADDLAFPMVGEMSGRIDVNFSAVQSLDVRDDLDEIQRDLQRRSNAVEPVFRDAKDFSEYIEVELDTTQAAHRNEASDMSITETIPSPKVNVSKIFSPPDKKSSLNWVSDKENNCLDDLKAKTLIFDDNADMSITTALQSKVEVEKQHTIIFDDTTDLSMTKPIPTKLLSDPIEVINKSSNAVCNMTSSRAEDITGGKRKTILFEDDLGDLSMTKPIPAKFLSIHSKSEEKVDLNNISNKSSVQTVEYREEKSRTILFEDDLGNLSMTKPIPANLLSIRSEIIEKSFTNVHANKSNLLNMRCSIEKSRTVLLDDDLQDLSLTKPISSKLLIAQNDSSNLEDNMRKSHDQRVDCNTEKRKTIIYDDGDLSMTKPIVARMLSTVLSEIMNKSNANCNFDNNKVTIEDNEDKLNDKAEKLTVTSITETITNENIKEKRKTILFDDGDGDLSMTKPIPTELLSIHSEILNKTKINDNLVHHHKSDILEYTNDESKFQTVHNEDEKLTDISVTKDQPNENHTTEKPATNDALINPSLHKSQTIVDDADMSITMETNKSIDNSMETRKSELVNDVLGDLSLRKGAPLVSLSDHSEIRHRQELLNKNHTISNVTSGKLIPMNLFNIECEEPNNITKTTERVSLDYSNFKSQDVVVYQVTTNESSKEQKDTSELEYDSEQGDVKAVQPSDNRIKNLSAVTINEDQIKEEKHLKDELRKSIKTSETGEVKDKDISRNASIYGEVGDLPVKSTISKKSLLCDLLDMSHASISSGLDDKNVTADIASEKPSAQEMPKTDMQSVTSEMFYITRDTDSETKSNVVKDKNAYPSITFVEKEKKNVSDDLQQSESVPETDTSAHNVCTEVKHSYADVNSSNASDFKKADFDNSNMELSRYPKSFSEVDNTKQLLDMLSDLTDGRRSQSVSGEGSPLSLTVTGRQNATENKMADPKRVSIVPNRQSIVLSREDLMSNISMAQAALQRSINMEDSDEEESMRAVAVSPPKSQTKSVRVSNEVVKTLHFEDESASEISVKSDLRTPLRKTALREPSHTSGGKANVIPTYLKDVSDGIKALMSDLVKPMPDDMPFEAVVRGDSIKRSNSTCSNQIQANLYTSSQIDMDINETYSNSDIMYHVEKDKNDVISNRSTLKSVSFIGSDVYSHSELVSRNLKEASFRPKRHPPSFIPGKTLVFDHENPLNNVLLTPTEFTEVHKYCPTESQDTLGGSDKSHTTQSSLRDNYDVANVTIPFNMHSYNTANQSAIKTSENASSNQSAANFNKPLYIEKGIGVKVTEVKDIEVNTAIVMKKNKELLEVSSSLTLVDDALARSTFDVQIDTEEPTESCSNLSDIKSPLKVIYKLKADTTEKEVDSEPLNKEDASKAKKRVYSPSSSVKSKNSSPSKLNVTPKPTAKMQKLSDTPNCKSFSLKRISGNKSLIDKNYSSAESKMDNTPSKESRKKKKKTPKKEGMSVMVQQLLTEFNVRSDVDQKDLNKQILEALSKSDSSTAPDSLSECERSVDMVSSFTSSKNQYKARPSSITTDADSVSEASPVDEWIPDQAESECDASVNVVAKIDMLPFMGSHECEWAPSGTDAWCFQLLHGRLRMHVRLAHRHHNATRSRVRADTPVRSVTVHQAYHANDQRNSVAMSCITFACAATRACASGCARAGAVPALLRRAAGVARAALAWGRVMHDARVHLAYTLSDDQRLVLKVANFPLRCVWEVSMRLVLTQDEAPWPQATHVRVTRVLDARPVTDARLAALLLAVPPGWGHVPTTVWKLFKYLKNYTPEAEEIGQEFDATVCS